MYIVTKVVNSVNRLENFFSKTAKPYSILILTLLGAVLWTIFNVFLDLINLQLKVYIASTFNSDTIITPFWQYSFRYYYAGAFYANPITIVILAFAPIICILSVFSLKITSLSGSSPTTNVLFPTTQADPAPAVSTFTRISQLIANVIGILFGLIYYSIFIILIFFRFRHTPPSSKQLLFSTIVYSIFVVMEVLFYLYLSHPDPSKAEQQQSDIVHLVIIGVLRFIELIFLNTIAFWPDVSTF